MNIRIHPLHSPAHICFSGLSFSRTQQSSKWLVGKVSLKKATATDKVAGLQFNRDLFDPA